MSAILRYSAEAENDLLEMHRHISMQSPDAATRLLRTIDAKYRMLAAMPGLGARRNQIRSGMRVWTVGNDLVLYRIEMGGIFVVRIVHGRRDLRRLFPGGPKD